MTAPPLFEFALPSFLSMFTMVISVEFFFSGLTPIIREIFKVQ